MYRRAKKIPTLLAIFILFAGIGGIVLVNQSTQRLTSKAQTESLPKDIHFTNITDASFTVSWFTDTSVAGRVVVGDGRNTLTYLEDADNDNIPRPRTAHFVTVKNLSENSSYLVKVISGDTACKIAQSCPEFTQKTANRLTNPVILPAARGSVITEDGKSASDAIVYLTVGKSPPLATKTDSGGLWVISFNNLYTSDFLTRPNLSDNDIVQIIGKASPDKKTEAVIDIKSIRQNLTIPPLQIGKSYNFIDLISKKDMLAGLNQSNTLGLQTQTGNPNNISSTSTSKSIDILFPSADDDTTTDNQPRFRGIAPKNTQLILTVNSSPQTARIITGADGTWSWRPTTPLEPGIHHLGITGYDEKGNYITLTRRFIVLKSGEQVLGEATASATLTPTTNPSPTPTLIPIASPTPTITLIPIASPTPKPATASATPIVPPKTGNITSTLILLGGGASLLLLGLKLLLLP